MPDRMLKSGDVVEVRPSPEILATLDKTGALDGVPFMPEMLQYVGRRFTVYKRAEKVCDPSGSRRMRDAVLLDDLRCDGSAHGGCQAECRFYWKEAWLRPVDAASAATPPPPVFIPLAEVARDTVRPLDLPSGLDATGLYRCQATEAITKTEQLRVRQPGQYVREVRGGNVTVSRFLRVGARALWGSLGHRLGFKAALPMKLAGKAAIKGEQLNLQPGEWVQVKSADEIGLTLDETGRNRGMKFSPEMVPACGQVFRVRGRVNRIIDEPTGKMLRFKAECIILEGNVCNGDYSPGRWFCPRELYPYWREAWLRRVPPPTHAPSS